MGFDVLHGILLGMVIVLLVGMVVISATFFEENREHRGTLDLLKGEVQHAAMLGEANTGLRQQIADLKRTIASLTVKVDTQRDALAEAASDLADAKDQVQRMRRPFNPDAPTSTDVVIMAQILAAECDNRATYAEIRLTAQVILNRVAFYHSSVKDVVMDPGQFMPVTTGAWLWAMPSALEAAAAYNAVCGIDTAQVTDPRLLFFCESGHEDAFFKNDLAFVIKLGDTSFYKRK